ncbi:hypothetical protein G6K86_32175 [Agrobacterium rhizogenes]|nr:hypothetical protein [Rhizobium rhizogenes]
MQSFVGFETALYRDDEPFDSPTPTLGQKRYSTALIGFGPANLGLLMTAYRRGALPNMCQNGLVIFEKSSRIGCGSLRDYKITANSLSSVFLECVADPRVADLVGDLAGERALSILQASPDISPRLSVVADLLERVAGNVVAHLSERYDITILREATVTALQEDERDFRITVNHESLSSILHAEAVFMNCGGRQILNSPLLGSIAPHIVTSDTLLRADDRAIRSLFDGAPHHKVAIVGGSHSAISSIMRLSEIDNNSEIVVYCRSPFRLYFESIAAARKADYHFAEDADVCPASGRVNRFSGLRYDAHKAAMSIMQAGSVRPDAPRVQFVITEDPITAAAQQQHDLCIVASGGVRIKSWTVL